MYGALRCAIVEHSSAARFRVHRVKPRRPACVRRSVHVDSNTCQPRRNAVHNGIALGFQRFEYGLEWYVNKATLLQANPGPVLVGTSYEFVPSRARGGGWSGEAGDGLRSARKYSGFPNHGAFWELIDDHLQRARPQNLHEVITADQPRCLYFDLDGDVRYKNLHVDIVGWLTHFVRWVFCGDRLGWAPGCPDPVVLTSSDPRKYSCHVVFPQIQFGTYEVQKKYLSVILDALPALTVELEGGEVVPILEKLVDRVPYMPFQMFRGPYACKFSGGQFHLDTQFQPENFFKNDPLACFASFANPDYMLEIPLVSQLLHWNEELRHFHEQQKQLIRTVSCSPGSVSPLDLANLYRPNFRQPGRSGTLDFEGMPLVEQYEVALQHLHPERATQWWSWFRICGVTYYMLERHRADPVARRSIWTAHQQWSSRFLCFDEQENVEMVMKCEGRRVSGIRLLHQLVKFDNPDLEVREPAVKW